MNKIRKDKAVTQMKYTNENGKCHTGMKKRIIAPHIVFNEWDKNPFGKVFKFMLTHLYESNSQWFLEDCLSNGNHPLLHKMYYTLSHCQCILWILGRCWWIIFIITPIVKCVSETEIRFRLRKIQFFFLLLLWTNKWAINGFIDRKKEIKRA